MTAKVSNLDISIDRGGTFTDCYAQYHRADDPVQSHSLVVKLLSQDPQNYDDAPREAIRRVLEAVTGDSHPRDRPLDTSLIRSIRMGTTVATNALLERRGERCAFLTTKGFKDLLVIGTQARPKIFELNIKRPDVLYQQVVEVDERVTLYGHTSGRSGQAVYPAEKPADCEYGVSGELVRILRRIDVDAIETQLRQLYDEGFRSVAVCLLHAYTYPAHEQTVGEVARRLGFTQVTLSHELMTMIKAVPRGNSACADAYLTPCIRRYLEGFTRGFDDRLLRDVPLQFMQSDGGLTPVDRFSGFRAILSGPAAGVVGCARTSYDPRVGTPVIGFDMGGTSTDVSRYDGDYHHIYETTTAGITIQAPQLDIHTVAAGGGSRLYFSTGMFKVGPESAGAHPGPACYRKGGPLTITDANLVLGRLISNHFPCIFGPNEDQPLDQAMSLHLFEELTREVNAHNARSGVPAVTTDDVAYGFIKVANEAMSRPIRALTEARGHDSADHLLTCFGGAGGQHACAIAESLGIWRVLVHRHASILSAYGLHLADVVQESLRPCALTVGRGTLPAELRTRMADLAAECRAELERQGFSADQIRLETYLNLRYQGTDSAIMTKADGDGGSGDYVATFEANYRREFGFNFPERDLIVDDLRVRGVGRSAHQTSAATAFREMGQLALREVTSEAGNGNQVSEVASVYFVTGRNDQTPVAQLADLVPGDVVIGPAIIIDPTFTLVVEVGWRATVTSHHVVLQRPKATATTTCDPVATGAPTPTPATVSCDPIQLAIFAHRFMGIAEQMGLTLQKTAISTNIKERLDFSCGLFDASGGLVANAPHIPVHLGSMGHAVRFQRDFWGADLHEGDVLLTNHPQAGGSHLPDMTVVTPVFYNGCIVFFVASRGHHADIGGILPGSMPPNSRELYEEGAAFRTFKVVDRSVFQEAALTRALVDDPAQYPGCSGTRCLRDNLSDLRAQIAANQRGITLLHNLVEEQGQSKVQAYMRFIQDNAAAAVCDLLRATARRYQHRDSPALHAVDYMDDGSRLELHITIEAARGHATFDFTGTSPQVYGNTNAPRAITYSAVIYCLRCLVQSNIPLNEGCLAPIDIIIPPSTLLNPDDGAAVVGGNVLTSQRVTDLVFRAMGAAAASYGCMNNLTFGVGRGEEGEARRGTASLAPGEEEEDEDEESDGSWGYYETIAGGSGAGPTWAGTSGVQCHMTNTRITDPEILERRYPVILHEFSLRTGSGGRGHHPGGDGVVRELEFLRPVQVSILSERRVFAPFGMAGGEPGAKGQNYWIRRVTAGEGEEKKVVMDRVLNLGGKSTCLMRKHDRIRILTPGGGGWGAVSESS
ncbi:hypothetical protein IWQ60_003405 [Tieghemiomyces parasiticus]|uniref:5-oxoprolinase n=1 Tax=Tieghemiomyces parasiticus TaxID=78921 RepID=A0A9W8E088_9FUNG|nr:hypothetical protein IWQ60_003405 [Tieghemiomyces parasiticus]